MAKKPYITPTEFVDALERLVDEATVPHYSGDEAFAECRICGEWEGHTDICPIPAILNWMQAPTLKIGPVDGDGILRGERDGCEPKTVAQMRPDAAVMFMCNDEQLFQEGWEGWDFVYTDVNGVEWLYSSEWVRVDETPDPPDVQQAADIQTQIEMHNAKHAHDRSYPLGEPIPDDDIPF